MGLCRVERQCAKKSVVLVYVLVFELVVFDWARTCMALNSFFEFICNCGCVSV
jgi:hypothetical protein